MKVRSKSSEHNNIYERDTGEYMWDDIAFRKMADYILDCIFCINKDGYFTFVNRASTELSGISPDTFYVSHLLDFVHPEDRDLAMHNIQRVIKDGKVNLYDLKLLDANGHEKIVEICSQAIRSCGNIIGFLAIARDITERKHKEDSLRISEEKYRLYMEDANDAIIVSDEDGYIINVNKKAEEMLGYSKEELYKMHFNQFHFERERSKSAFLEILKNEKGGMNNTMVLRKNGNTVPVDISSRAIELAGRKVVRGSYKDISDHLEIKDKLEEMVRERTKELDAKNETLLVEIKEREKAEERIRKLYSQLVKSQEIERQRISYDLHDNLAQDLFSLKIKLDTFFADQPSTSAENRERISKLSEIVKRTIGSIREMAHELTPRGLKLLGLVSTLSRYCKDFSKEYGIMVDFFPAGIDKISMNYDIELTLYRIIQECLNNIRKHADATHVTIKLVMSFPNIILRIKDNGKGFDVQKELCTTGHERQMGLHSIDERVTILKGKLKIESRLMQGTEVVIEIPWRDKDEQKENRVDN